MNWNLILNKYPRSILGDEKSLLLLALLERNGLATEDELSNNTNFEKYLLKKALIDLQLNQLIQYGSNYVRLTEKGKNIIERFGLLEPIVSDFVDSLGFEGKEKKDFEQVLFQYRNTSFEFYQNSLCTIRVWKDLVEELPSEEGSSQFLEEIIGGMRTLLLRDLRNWWAHSHQPSSVFRDVNKDIRLMICSTNLQETEIPKTWNSKKIYALIFLNKLENKNLHLDLPNSIGNKREIEPLISAFHVFQYNSAPFEWYDDLCTALPEISNKGKIESKDIFIKTFTTLLKQSKIERKLLKTDKEISINIYHDWIPTKKDTFVSSDIFEMLMIASDINELSSRTGIQEASLRKLLVDIRNKCDNLLDVKNNSNRITQK
jgi:hypothetical protein